jgi:hypothetical protein
MANLVTYPLLAEPVPVRFYDLWRLCVAHAEPSFIIVTMEPWVMEDWVREVFIENLCWFAVKLWSHGFSICCAMRISQVYYPTVTLVLAILVYITEHLSHEDVKWAYLESGPSCGLSRVRTGETASCRGEDSWGYHMSGWEKNSLGDGGGNSLCVC